MRHIIMTTSALAVGLLAFAAGAQPADCVTGLSQCAQRCDLRVKLESQERPRFMISPPGN